MKQPIRVLLVDDEPDFPETAATFLEREDDRLEVTPATSAREGLARHEETPFDCVVSDYAMPKMDGLEFLEAVREESPELPFVLYTARGSEDVASEAITAGVSDYYQRDHHGEEEYVVLANRITNLVERHRAEQEAERNRSHLQAITESSADAIIAIDTDGTIQFANAAVRNLFGYDPEALVGESLTTLMPERYREDHVEAVDRYLETGQRGFDWSNMEFTGLRANGKEVPLSTSYGEFEYDGERRIVGIFRDITARKEETRRLETLISNLPGIVYRCRNEPGWPMDFVRGECESITGYSASALEAGDVVWGEDVIHPDDQEETWATVQAAIEAGDPFELTYRTVTADGEVKWMWERGQIVTTHSSDRVLEGFIFDVTDRRERETQLVSLDRMLRHNLHNELNVVLGYADMIEREGEGPVTAYASTIETASRRVLEQADKEREIVDLLTDQSPPERLDLRGVLEAMVDRFESSYPDAAITLDLPEQLRVTTIPEITRAIEELAINAIVHCKKDVPELTIRGHNHDGRIEISVRDNGPGMPSQERHVIGEDSPIDPLVHSSGMGLWLVKRTANRAGGTLRFEENDPEGSVVSLVIPDGNRD